MEQPDTAPTSPHPQVTLSNLANGAADQLFHAELQRCLENIQDPNTKAEAPRVITLKITLLPDEKRQFMDVEIQSACKMAAIKPTETRVHIARVRGQNLAKEQRAPQMGLPGEGVTQFPAAVPPGSKPAQP